MAQTDTSNVFREKSKTETKSEGAKHKSTEEVSRDGGASDEIEAPFTEYRTVNAYPFLVEYFDIGDSWKEKLGGFEKEVESIEGYFKDKIEEGKMRNETKLVEDEIKKISKFIKIDKSERVTMQIEKLAAYIEFLKRTDKIEYDRYRYR